MKNYTIQYNFSPIFIQMSQKVEIVFDDESSDEEIIIEEDIGKIIWKGPFGGSVSWNGLQIDLLKSAMQKYLRRRVEDKMIWCCIELDLFKKVKEAKSVRTNNINRLIVMCGEELCFSDWSRLILIKEKISKWEEGDRENGKLLVEICRLLCRGKLIRISSDICSVFGKGITYELSSHLVNFERKGDDDIKQYIKKGDREEVLIEFRKFVECFNQQNDEMFYWMFKLCKMGDEGFKGATRWRRSRCEYIIWDFLILKSKNSNLEKVLNIYLEWFFDVNRRERNFFLVSAVLCVKNQDRINWNVDLKVLRKSVKVDDKEYEELERKNTENSCIEIDNYCIDMHCKKGRDIGKDRMVFATEGSLVVDEDKEYYNDEYRKIYYKVKEIDNEKYGGELNIKKVKKQVKNIIEEKLPFVDWKEIKKNSELCNDGKVCGQKPPCISTKLEGKDVILKECSKGVNYGRDSEMFDKMKTLVGLRRNNVRRIISNIRLQKNKFSMSRNFGEEKATNVVYMVMDKFEGEMLTNRKKEWYGNKDIRKEYIRILLVRGVFNVSDGNERNVLINENDKLCSIDEMVIFKENKKMIGIMNKKLRDLCLRDLEEGYFDDIFNTISEGMKKDKIKEILKEYNYEEKIDSVMNKIKNLKSILRKELDI